jgi:hypothetical protein
LPYQRIDRPAFPFDDFPRPPRVEFLKKSNAAPES